MKKTEYIKKLQSTATLCLRRKYVPLLLPFRKKAPNTNGWQNGQGINAKNVHERFNGLSNLGVLLGPASGNLIDGDLDHPFARELAPLFLPETGMIHGRKSASDSHWWYQSKRPLIYQKYNDIDGKSCILELRTGQGKQTMAPPSQHPCGEFLNWTRGKKPAVTEGPELEFAFACLAVSVLIAIHWLSEESQTRHQLALAYGGLFARGGIEAALSAKIVGQAARAAGDKEWKDRHRAVLDSANNFAQGKPVTGIPTVSELLQDGEKIVSKIQEWLNFQGPQTEMVNSQTPEAAPWPQPIAPEGHGLAGEFIRLIEPQSESDAPALLIQFLVAFGNVIGRTAHFQVEADRHFTNLFGVIVGESSKSRKGTSWGHIRRIFHEVDPTLAIRNGRVSGEGLIWAVRDPVTKLKTPKTSLKRPKNLIEFVDEQTPIIVDPGITDKRLFVLEPEFASILVIMSREGNILSPTLRQAWDTGELQTLAKSSQAQAKSSGAHISIMGHVTRDELRRYLTKTEVGNGFANRFIWICSRRSKCLPRGGRVSYADLAPLIDRLREAVGFARRVELLKWGEKAAKLWDEIYPALSEGKPGLFGAVTSRAEAQTLRVACIFALLDCSSVLKIEHLRAALAVWKYAENSARHIFGNSTGDPTADQILSFLKTSPNGKTKTEIHGIFNRNVSAERIESALLHLEGSQTARRASTPTRGRPEERWFA